MRLIGLSFLILLFASCCSCPDRGVNKAKEVLKVNTYLDRVYDSKFSSRDNSNHRTFEIRTSILNQSDTSQAFWIMNCSSSDNFILSSRQYYIVHEECNKNFPTVIDIQPHDSIAFIVNIHSCAVGYKGKQDSIRIGFAFVNGRKFDSSDDYEKIMNDKSLQTVIWSNKLSLNGK